MVGISLVAAKEKASRIEERVRVFDFERFVNATQFVKFALRVKFADRYQTEQTSMRLKVTPIVVLDWMFLQKANPNIADLTVCI